jgi:uncharacterized membrane protein YedE/YeeE
VNEYPLPAGANISLVNMLHRHGSRYPTSDAGVVVFGKGLQRVIQGRQANFTGALSFLDTWSYQLGWVFKSVNYQAMADMFW